MIYFLLPTKNKKKTYEYHDKNQPIHAYTCLKEIPISSHPMFFLYQNMFSKEYFFLIDWIIPL